VSGRSWLAVGLVWLLGAGGGLAQERRPGPLQRQTEAFRMVDAYMIANIQESLGLDDPQFARIVPLVKALQAARREHFTDRARALRQLRVLLESGTATEEQLGSAVAELKSLEVEGPARILEKQDALDAALDPVQQAKYRVFEAEVERRIRELARRVRQQRGPQGRDGP